MKKVLFLFLFLFLLVPCCVNSAEVLNNYVVMDMDSGRIFKELSKDERILPASTTKIMTSIVVIENSNLADVIKVGDEILTIEGSNIYAEIGENILMQDLLYGMMLRSGNDAAMILANHSGGSVENFVKLMNEKTKILGLKNTYFENPTGLDDNNKNTSSVYDLALIYSYAYKNKNFRDVVGAKTYKMSSDKKSYYFRNRNDLLNKYKYATGGKTGYTPKAGRLLVTSAYNGDLNLVIASRGNSYGYNTHISFYDDIFSKYKNYTILDRNNFKEPTELDGTLYIKNSFVYPLSEEEENQISKKLNYTKNKDGEVGEIVIYLGKDVIHKEKVYLRENKLTFTDKIKKFFHINCINFKNIL